MADNQLFSGSYDRTARAWSVDKGQVSQEFRGHRNCVLTLAYSAPWDLPGAPCAEEAGGLLVTGSTDGTARVWQVAGGGCWQTLRGHTGAVLCLVLDTPSHTAFTGSTDATIRAWDILSGEQLRVFREHQGPVICLEVRSARPLPVRQGGILPAATDRGRGGGGSDNGDGGSHGSGGWKAKAKVPACSRTSSPCILTRSPLRIQNSSADKDAGPTGLAPTLVNSSSLSHLLRDPVSKYSHVHRSGG